MNKICCIILISALLDACNVVDKTVKATISGALETVEAPLDILAGEPIYSRTRAILKTPQIGSNEYSVARQNSIPTNNQPQVAPNSYDNNRYGVGINESNNNTTNNSAKAKYSMEDWWNCIVFSQDTTVCKEIHSELVQENNQEALATKDFVDFLQFRYYKAGSESESTKYLIDYIANSKDPILTKKIFWEYTSAFRYKSKARVLQNVPSENVIITAYIYFENLVLDKLEKHRIVDMLDKSVASKALKTIPFINPPESGGIKEGVDAMMDLFSEVSGFNKTKKIMVSSLRDIVNSGKIDILAISKQDQRWFVRVRITHDRYPKPFGDTFFIFAENGYWKIINPYNQVYFSIYGIE